MKYEIKGDTLPVVICELEPGETMINESGAMSWMSANMQMETSTNGGVGKALGRLFSGDKFFQNRYTPQGGPGMVAFSSCFPGSIKAFEITPDKPMILQKHSFLASEESVTFEMFFQKKFGSGLFGGEGFMLQKFSGNGIAFAEFDGHVVEYDLKPGQVLKVDTGHVAAFEASVNMDIETVKGAKNIFFGGEGLFLTTLTGPGKVWLQTMPIQNLAQRLIPYMPTASSSN